MRSRRRLAYSTAVATALLLSACAYPPQRSSQPPPLGAPSRPALTATATVTWQPAGSAQAITWTTTYARDSQGRTRIDTIVLATASAAGAPERIVTISDPVTQRYWRVYPASGRVFPRGQGYDPTQMFSGWVGQPPQSAPQARRITAHSSGPCTGAGQSGVGFELDYLQADGALVGTSERCAAPEFGVNLLLRQTAADGALLYSFVLDSLHLDDPDPALFLPPKSASVPDISANRQLAATVFHQARAATSSLPPELAASDLETIAFDEITALPTDQQWQQQVRSDLISIFHQIVGTTFPPPVPPPNAPANWTPYNPKESIEANLVRALSITRARQESAAVQSQFKTVLDLIQQADVRKAPLYDALLASSFARSGVQFDPLALIAQCQQDDGSFPYQAALMLMQRGGVTVSASGSRPVPGSLDQAGEAALLHMADAAAEADQDPAGLGEAVNFLLQTAPLDPVAGRPRRARFSVDLTAFRADWESAVEALLQHHPAPSRASALLPDLQKVDPDAAATFAPPTPTPQLISGGRGGVGLTRSNLLNVTAIQSDPQTALAADEAQTGPNALRDLVNFAQIEAFQNPLIAGQAASAAISALGAPSSDATNSRNNIPMLLNVLDNLGMTDRADALLPVLLQRASQDAQTAQANFDNLSADQQNRPVQVGGQAANDYRQIARLNLTAAIAAAQKLDTPAVQPLILAAVASQIH